jgi:5-methyltetrahydropteroyltriglutamate--homocysteine methyltransferase
MPRPSTETIYRADVVGSMLRPPELIEARAAMRAGQLPPEQYRKVEDQAVDEALRIQEQAGVDVATDGEMRRDIFFGFFITGLTGLSPLPAYTVRFQGKTAEDAMAVTFPFSVTEKLSTRPCPALEEFAYASERTSLPVKVTLPSPMMILGFWSEHSRDAYPDPFELATDAAGAVAGWMRELADAGCRYIQIDAPELNQQYADAAVRADCERRGISAERFLAVGTELVGSLADVDLPGVTVGLHVCKGNGTQSWIAEGGYEEFSRQVFKRASGFDVFHLEYDDERSGGFEPLRNLPDDKVAVLGLVSTKWVALEDPDVLRARISEAARHHPMDRLALATQCGFASAAETAEQRRITPQTQADKLRLIADVAHSLWQ